MEEKVIIKSEKYNTKKILIAGLIIGIVAFFVLFFALDTYYYLHTWAVIDRKEHATTYDPTASFLKYYLSDGDGDFLMTFWFDFLVGFCGPMLIAFLPFLWLKNYELTITDKRAYGRAAFGRRVDLPVDSISAIGRGWLKNIKISTASGGIKFFLIKNRDKMYEVISNLIIERQSKQRSEAVASPTPAPAPAASDADELKKFKDLLDSGIITQEEFDAKKKQLLGL